MLGKSSRFFKAGYSIPKYQLPLGNETIFAKSVRSFENYFHTLPFLFLVRSDFDAISFVSQEVRRMGLKDYRIIEFSIETRGQAESVEMGIRDYSDDLPLLIFNIDTIRHNFLIPDLKIVGDGFLEVFEADGDGWSFIEPGDGGRVLRTTEKLRISNLCSNGLYYFSNISMYREAYYDSIDSIENENNELYIAPLYNYLIKKSCNIYFNKIDPHLIGHCGVPEDYEKLKIHYTQALFLITNTSF